MLRFKGDIFGCQDDSYGQSAEGNQGRNSNKVGS